MSKLKVFELLLSALTSVITIAKAVIKLIQHLVKLKKPQTKAVV